MNIKYHMKFFKFKLIAYCLLNMLLSNKAFCSSPIRSEPLGSYEEISPQMILQDSKRSWVRVQYRFNEDKSILHVNAYDLVYGPYWGIWPLTPPYDKSIVKIKAHDLAKIFISFYDQRLMAETTFVGYWDWDFAFSSVHFSNDAPSDLTTFAQVVESFKNKFPNLRTIKFDIAPSTKSDLIGSDSSEFLLEAAKLKQGTARELIWHESKYIYECFTKHGINKNGVELEFKQMQSLDATPLSVLLGK